MADTQRDMESTDSTTLILVTKLKNSFEISGAIRGVKTEFLSSREAMHLDSDENKN